VVHSSDRALGVYPVGVVVLENDDEFDDAPRHMHIEDRERVLAAGRLVEVLGEPWQSGPAG
jgi:hypothetical protein